MAEDMSELKKLPAEERLRKLRELAEKRKKEIEEAQALMRTSEEELEEGRKLQEKIPIPQMIGEEGVLETGEEKEMFTVHRQKGRVEERKGKRDEGQIEGKVSKEEESVLEETVAKEAREAPKLQAEKQYGDAMQMSTKPVEYFASVFKNVAEKVYNVGGVSNLPSEDKLRFEYATKAWDKKLEDIETGRYAPTKEALREAVVTAHLHEKLQAMYRAQAGGIEKAPGQEHEFKEFEDDEKYAA